MTSTEFAKNRDNFCYRHPDRMSFVLCQRCLRTVCPECQTPAPVGVICPECMTADRKAETPAQKRARRQRGARVMAMGSEKPVITYGLMIVTTVLGVLQLFPGIGDAITLIFRYHTAYMLPELSVYPFEPWRLVTSAFVHGGLLHLSLNMLSLWMLGRILEPLLGRWRFLTLYLLSAIGGSVAVSLISPSYFTVGASGALFGLLGALLIIGRHIGADIRGILVLFAINLVIGFIPSFGIAWQAHVGGAVTGALASLVILKTQRPKQRIWQVLGLVAVLALLLVLLFVAVPAILTAG